MNKTPSKFTCHHCAAELGTTDGVRLMILAMCEGELMLMTFRRSSLIPCPKCQRSTKWFQPQSQAEKDFVFAEVAVV